MISAIFRYVKRIPLVAYVIIAAIGYVVATQLIISHERRRTQDASYARDSVIAVNDKTKKLADGFARRAVQSEISRDSIDRKLGLVTKAKQELELQLAGGEATDSSPIKRDAHGWSATFHAKVAPASVDVLVTGDTAAAKADIKVAFDPFTIGVSVKCGPEANGVRPATVLVQPPLGIKVDITSAQQDRGVCSPEQAAPRSHAKAAFVAGGAAGLLLGYLIIHYAR